MAPPKRHHYVPRFYLKRFVRKGEKGREGFWVYDKDGGDPRWQQPDNTAVERYFYRVEHEDGRKDDSIEEMLSKVESGFVAILDRWLSPGGSPQPEDLPVASAFLALMHTRSPRSVEAVREVTTRFAIDSMRDLAERPEELRRLLAKMAAQGKAWKYEEAVEALRNVEEWGTLSITNKYPLVASLRLTEEVATTFAQMNWSLCLAPTGSSFITCDAPVCVFLATGPGRGLFGGGLGDSLVEVSFPLSPDACLWLTRKHRQRRIRSGGSFVEEINRRTAFMAERFVISDRRTKAVAALVADAARTRRMPKMDRDRLAEIFRYVRERRSRASGRGPRMSRTPSVRCYHEAGHALLALHLGVKVKDVYGGDVARTIHEPESYAAASDRDRALITLAGGVAEEVVFGERSPDCCAEDLARAAEHLALLAEDESSRDALRAQLEAEVREILGRPAFRAALDVLAGWLSEHSLIAGPWAPELLWKNCPEIRPFLRVRPDGTPPE